MKVELTNVNFLVPTQKVLVKDYGYQYRETFCQALAKGGVIGQYQADESFVENIELSRRYANIIPRIAKALLSDTHDPLYQSFKLASLDRSSLELTLEWRIADKLNTKHLPLHFGQMLRDQLGLTTVLVDLQGPAYEVVALDTVDAFVRELRVEDVQVDSVEDK